MTQDTAYNGWTNYATWRVNLEYFDCFDLKDRHRDQPDAHDLADELRDEFMEYLETDCENTLTLSYAQSFASDVDFLEIAEHLIEDAEYETEEAAQ
jgi:hypothetical protein